MHGRRASGSVYSQAMAGCDSVSFYVTLLNPNLYINAEVIGDDLEVSPLLFGHPCVLVSPRTQETWKRKIMFTCSSNLQWNFLIFITPPPLPHLWKKKASEHCSVSSYQCFECFWCTIMTEWCTCIVWTFCIRRVSLSFFGKKYEIGCIKKDNSYLCDGACLRAVFNFKVSILVSFKPNF